MPPRSSAAGSPDQTRKRPEPLVTKAPAPALLVKLSPAMSIEVPLPAPAVRTAPVSSTTPEPAVGPSFTMLIVLAVISPTVMSPLALFVLPAPSRSSRDTAPGPASMAVPFAMAITAAPASRSASTTPLARRSLAISVTSPPALPAAVVMSALTRIDRPACRVSPPMEDGVPVTVTASATVMSLEACSVTAVPRPRRATMSAAATVAVSDGLSAKDVLAASGSLEPVNR